MINSRVFGPVITPNSAPYVPEKSLEYAVVIANNLHPIFEYYGWTYSFAGGVPQPQDLLLNITNLMHAAMTSSGGAAESGRIRVEYDPDNFPKDQPFGVYLGTLEQIKPE